MSVNDLLSNTKVGVAVSTATTGSGVTMLLDIIPDDIGKLATVMGIVLSLVLIYTHVKNLKKINTERRKLELEVKLLEAKLKDC